MAEATLIDISACGRFSSRLVRMARFAVAAVLAIGFHTGLVAQDFGVPQDGRANNGAAKWLAEQDVAFLKVDEAFALTTERGSCLLYTSPSPRDATLSRMPSSA